MEAHLCLVCWRTQTSKDRHEDHMVRYHRDSEKTKVRICQSGTGISSKEKIRKEHFFSNVFITLFIITELFLKSEYLLLFKLNLLMVPIVKKPATVDHKSSLKIILAKHFLSRCPYAPDSEKLRIYYLNIHLFNYLCIIIHMYYIIYIWI